ncbi:hypothetical protein KKKH51_14200 [Helicobacter pylori]
MKNRYHESHIIRSINKNGYTETDRMVEDYPKLKAENAELKQVHVVDLFNLPISKVWVAYSINFILKKGS